MMAKVVAAELKKLYWRCRRGTKELDALLSGFLHSHGPHLTSEQRHRFSLLLQQEDDVLWDWLSGQRLCTDPELQDIIHVIRAAG